jgi:hypothetical protein
VGLVAPVGENLRPALAIRMKLAPPNIGCQTTAFEPYDIDDERGALS